MKNKKILLILSAALLTGALVMSLFAAREKLYGKIEERSFEYKKVFVVQKDYKDTVFLCYEKEIYAGGFLTRCKASECDADPGEYINPYDPDIKACSLFTLRLTEDGFDELTAGRPYFTGDIYVSEAVVIADDGRGIFFTYASEKKEKERDVARKALAAASKGEYTLIDNESEMSGKEVKEYIKKNGFKEVAL